MADDSSGATSLQSVRRAFRSELEARGLSVSSDTLGLRSELYVLSEDDLARALFHFHTDAEDAADSLYRSSGSWVEGMPPRFVVLPSSESQSPAIEILEQMRTAPVFYDANEGKVAFRNLDCLVEELR